MDAFVVAVVQAAQDAVGAVLEARKRMTKQAIAKLKRNAKKHKNKKKIWVEVSQQPKKKRGHWMGRASFYWSTDHEKKKHSVNIPTHGPARMSIRSRKVWIQPKGEVPTVTKASVLTADEHGYFYGEKADDKESAKGSEKHEAKDKPRGTPQATPHEEVVLDPHKDTDGDGVADAARVGVPARSMAPPPKLTRLHGLDEKEKHLEEAFLSKVENHLDECVKDYSVVVLKKAKDDNMPPSFVTDDAKILDPQYFGVGFSHQERQDFRARHNVLFHQGANAVTKHAFVRYLDELAKLPKDDAKRHVLVTSGGCGAGKGYCTGEHGPASVQALQKQVGAVWDAAGEQNATENPWIMDECRKRGLKATFMFVDADPKNAWANPKRGVVARAAKPDGEGRMVASRLFADSYALGAKNFEAFEKDNRGKSDCRFIYMNVRGEGDPKMVDGLSDEAKGLNADELHKFADDVIKKGAAPTEAIKYGALVGDKIWPANKEPTVEKPPKPEEKKPVPEATPATTRPKVAASVTLMRMIMADEDKDDGLKQLKETLLETYKRNVADLDAFDKRKNASDMKAWGMAFDKNGKIVKIKTKKNAAESKNDKTSAAARIDAAVERIVTHVTLPVDVQAKLEAAAEAVAAAEKAAG